MHRGRANGSWVLLGFAVTGFASAETAYTTKSVNMRAGPGREYPAVTRIREGTPVEVAGCLEDWTWCDVIAKGDRGWVYAGSLDYPYEGERAPILSRGQYYGLPVIGYSPGLYWDTYYRGRPFYGRRDYWVSRPFAGHRSVVIHPGGPPRPGSIGPRPIVVERSRPGYRSRVDHPRTVERSRTRTVERSHVETQRRVESPRHVESQRARPQPHAAAPRPDRKKPGGPR